MIILVLIAELGNVTNREMNKEFIQFNTSITGYSKLFHPLIELARYE